MTENNTTLTPEALRAARGLLNWGVRDLASASGVAFTSISQFENGRPMRRSTSLKLIAALEAQGVEFILEPARSGAALVRVAVGGGDHDN